MAIIRKINNKAETIAEISKIDHNQLTNREQYGCHSISAIRKLPEKLTDLKNKDIELSAADELIKEDIRQVEENARNISIDKVGSSIKFTSYGSETFKSIDLISPEDLDNDTIELNSSSKISLRKVYINEENLKGLGTPESPLDVLNTPDNVTIKVKDNKLTAKALEYPETTESSLFNNSVTVKDIDDRFIANEASLANLSNRRTQDVDAINSHIESINNNILDIENLDKTQNDKITDLMSRTKGLGGYLNAYNFKSATPSQNDITNYAMQETGISDRTKIFNQTKVKNLFDSNIWVLTNTPDSDPVVFSWANVGQENIADANNNGIHGLVTGSYEDFEASIDATGHISINGLEELANKVTANTTAISELNNNIAKVNAANIFTEINTFNKETQFNAVAQHSADINITNGIVKILDSAGSKNLTTQYHSDSIIIEDGTENNTYNLVFPKKSGTLALESDITSINATPLYQHNIKIQASSGSDYLFMSEIVIYSNSENAITSYNQINPTITMLLAPVTVPNVAISAAATFNSTTGKVKIVAFVMESETSATSVTRLEYLVDAAISDTVAQLI